MREEDVCLQLFLDWLNQAHGRRFQVDEREDLPVGGLSALASDGSFRLAVELHHLIGPTDNPAWLALRDRLQNEIAVELAGAFALWLSTGADLPSGARETLEFVQWVRQTAVTLQPGERTIVPFPITLHLKKVREEGNLMSVVGGMNPYWARFTERIRGSFDLDSTQLHRLPESEEHLQQLIDSITEASQRIQNVGQWVEIDTIDAWTIQRLEGDHGVAIVGVAPDEVEDVGLAVRRNFRRILADAAPRLRQRGADLRALVVLGYYSRVEQEGATTALRGYDPTLYANLDFVCLVVDGLVKPLLESPLLPWA